MPKCFCARPKPEMTEKLSLKGELKPVYGDVVARASARK